MQFARSQAPALIVIYKCLKARRSGRESVAGVAGIQFTKDGFVARFMAPVVRGSNYLFEHYGVSWERL